METTIKVRKRTKEEIAVIDRYFKAHKWPTPLMNRHHYHIRLPLDPILKRPE